MKKRTKKRMTTLLLELLKDSKRSDRELSKVLGVFTVIPDFVKMGYEIMAISFVKKRTPITELNEKAVKWWKKYPNVIFAAAAEGMGKNGVLISLHKNFTDYSNFVTEQLRYWEDEIADYDTMLISLKGTIAKPLSLKYLAEQEET